MQIKKHKIRLYKRAIKNTSTHLWEVENHCSYAFDALNAREQIECAWYHCKRLKEELEENFNADEYDYYLKESSRLNLKMKNLDKQIEYYCSNDKKYCIDTVPMQIRS